MVEIPAATADGAKVETTVELDPPVGVWQLDAADTPTEGLRRSIADAASALSSPPSAVKATISASVDKQQDPLGKRSAD
jgi:hypothetical protein